MARWMVHKEARNIVLVSRSGSATAKIRELVDEVADVGARIIPRRCDVSNSESVQNFVGNELAGMLEVRGVIHGTMVLHASRFWSI